METATATLTADRRYARTAPVRLAVQEDPEKVLLLARTLNAVLEEAGTTIG
ncbi:hypothetical protein [Streptomyces cinereoruber]|uniref:hypothetical protein n=1 Tax=Streptomyces cinereoruber TaxID=67260 RepID=UPI00363AC8EA